MINIKKTKWISCTLLAMTFIGIDIILRWSTRWLGYYSVFEIPPLLFSVCWSIVFIVFFSLLPQRIGRIAYMMTYFVWSMYAIAQYIYYLIFNKFFFVSDMQYATEGGEYLNYILSVLNTNVWLMAVLFIMMGIIGFVIFPDLKKEKIRAKGYLYRVGLLVGIGSSFLVIPCLYTENKEAPFLSSKYEYATFTNSGFDMEIAGIYQYVGRDFYKTYLKSSVNKEKLHEEIDDYFNNKQNHANNSMTGVLEGKNLILIQMESLDDWVINENSTPTIARLMKEGINFTNMYTCLYGSGSTFSTEFAFNTGVYQSTKSVAAYSYAKNCFPYSLANLCKNDDGYKTNSFHQNVSGYYNRNIMHNAMGYEKYHCLRDYVEEPSDAEFDENMIENDNYWEIMTNEKPFLSFLITYSCHVPYSGENDLAKDALTRYPEYEEMNINEEMRYLYAKARLTDEMFASLIRRLEEDDLLESTAIIAYTDHYCYGLSDKEIIHRLSKEKGIDILERTPAFIWYAGCNSLNVEKVCQTIDWVPTIANMLGKDVTVHMLGNDIFDDNYEGYAIFPDGTWLTKEAYVVNGNIKWNKGMSNDEVEKMNLFVQTFYETNEAILASDYYKKFTEK